MMFWIAFASAAPTLPDLVQTLSARHEVPACAVLEEGLADPAAMWRSIVDTVSMPPWVPMRAATCLIENHPDEATLTHWSTAPDTRGLARLVLRRLDTVDSEVALRVARSAMTGPHQDLARPLVSKSPDPRIRALATP